jgi:cell division protein FtsI (penicillin-binding protein 3)
MIRGNAPATGGIPPQQRTRRRTRSLAIVLLCFFLVIVARLVHIQIIKAGVYRERAKKQYEAKVELPAARGIISDRNGRVLVSNSVYLSYAADPSVIGDDRDEIATRFARVFNKPRETYISDLRDQSKQFVWLERSVKPSLSARIPVGEFHGLIAREEPKRLYHYNHAAVQLIGLTGTENGGLNGLEQQYDKWLRGRDGYVILQRDALRRTHPSLDYPRLDPIDGQNLVLTIDADIQSVVEEELERGVRQAQAESGIAVMVDPSTGEILAMSTYPTVDPENTTHLDLGALRNRVITDPFEPGSIFKLVTTSAVLENKCARLDEKFNAENGIYKAPIGGGKFRSITDTHPHSMLTFQEAVEQSSNIVMAKVALRIGPEALFRMARGYGFGASTGIELPAEAPGSLKRPGEWSGTTLQSMAFGYDVSVTALQIVMAYAAVANHGMLMKPYVVHQVLDAQGNVTLENSPQRVRSALSLENATTLTKLLEGVVERGTGTPAKVKGLRIAGKTGTSRQAAEGKYTAGDYTASFVGFFPAENPKAVCLVVLDRPRAGSYYGGQASAPIFKAIVEKIRTMADRLHTAAPAPKIAEGSSRAVPDVRNVRTDVAVSLLKNEGFVPDVTGAGSIVVEQSPAPGTALQAKSKVTLGTNSVSRSLPAGFALVPEVRGLSVRRAINQLSTQQLEVSVIGSGNVRTQSPAPGEKVPQGTSVVLRCEPRPVPVGNL